jgi:gamma-glutamyl hydrolase
MIFSSNAVVTTALMTWFGISSASSLHQTQDAHNNLRKNEKTTTPMGKRNDWPVIGMFTQPSTSKHEDCNGDCLYLAASYVKYLESAGARVVPINYYATPEQLDYLFNSLNGFFFVGGGSSIPQSAQYIYDRTVEANDADDFMPLWGTCLGFEWLIIATSGDLDILDPKDGQMDAYNISLPLEFTSSARQSKLFRDAPPGVYEILAKKDVTMNNHHYGIFTDNFKATESLSSFYDIISVNKDRNGVEFVSTLEAFKYPIYATQWHPEKNPFE